VLLVLLSAHPHLLEGAERAEDRSSNPRRGFDVSRVQHLNFETLGRNIRDLSLQALFNSFESRITTRNNHIAE